MILDNKTFNESKVRIARAALHMWEEPCISGENGSGTVFFPGCNLKCVFCQNYVISRGKVGHNISVSELAETMLSLQEQKANNINLVTAGHFLKPVVQAVESARNQGLTIPIVYNTSSYEPVDNIKRLEGIVNVYLPDLKYVSSDLSLRYSGKADYFDVASLAIKEMVRQTKDVRFTDEQSHSLILGVDDYQDRCEDESLIMTRGTIVRHLLLPGCLCDSKAVVKQLIEIFGDDIFISIMNQYTPLEHVKELCPELYKKTESSDYETLLDYAIELGLNNGFFQDGDVALESFIPDFN